LEERTIIKKFKQGDVAAFDTIYYRYSKKLYNFAIGLVKDQDNAGEIVQEVFVNLWEKRNQIDIALSFENYLFTIAYNSIRKYFRKKSIETKVKDYLLKNSSELVETSDSTVIYNELLELANKSIEKLPPRRRMVYKLSRQEGMKIKQIASKLDISIRTAESHLSKALKYLKKELESSSLFSLLFFYLFLS